MYINPGLRLAPRVLATMTLIRSSHPFSLIKPANVPRTAISRVYYFLTSLDVLSLRSSTAKIPALSQETLDHIQESGQIGVVNISLIFIKPGMFSEAIIWLDCLSSKQRKRNVRSSTAAVQHMGFNQ